MGEVPFALQSKFLRVLQEKQYERVGEEKTRTVDVRIIAASNRDLKKDAEEGRFRQDFYYRLNVFPIEVPPLRERKEDIPLLATHFLQQAARRLRLPMPRFSETHSRLLQSYDWPGNVRELQNATERALILAQKGVLHFDLRQADLVPPPPAPPPSGNGAEASVLTEAEWRARERANMEAALAKSALASTRRRRRRRTPGAQTHHLDLAHEEGRPETARANRTAPGSLNYSAARLMSSTSPT